MIPVYRYPFNTPKRRERIGESEHKPDAALLQAWGIDPISVREIARRRYNGGMCWFIVTVPDGNKIRWRIGRTAENK